MMGMGEEASSCGSISIRHFRFEFILKGFFVFWGAGGDRGRVGDRVG